MLKNGESLLSILDLKHCAAKMLGVAPERVNCELRYIYSSQFGGKTPLRYYFSLFILKASDNAQLNFRLLKSNIQVPFSIAPINLCSYAQVPFFADEIYPMGGVWTGLFYEFTVI